MLDVTEKDGTEQSQFKSDILKAVIKAMEINEVSGSQQNFLSILQYGKELYSR